MKTIIVHVHVYGNYIAGDHFDIHDNSSVTICPEQPSSDTSTRETCVEDITPVEEDKPCPFLVAARLAQLGLYTPEQFEAMFREAAEKDAKTLALFLKKYRQLGVLDFQGRDKKQIFTDLQAHFPTMKSYSYRNFTEYF